MYVAPGLTNSEGRPWTAIRNFSYRELQTLQLKHVYIYWQHFFVKSKYEKKIEIKLTQLNSVKLTYHQAKEKKIDVYDYKNHWIS